MSGLRRVRELQPRFRRGGEADARRTTSAAQPWHRCTCGSSAAWWGHATWSMSSATGGGPALVAVVRRRQNRGTCEECDRPTCRARAGARRNCAEPPNRRSGTSDDGASSPPVMRPRMVRLSECLDGDATFPQPSVGRTCPCGTGPPTFIGRRASARAERPRSRPGVWDRPHVRHHRALQPPGHESWWLFTGG